MVPRGVLCLDLSGSVGFAYGHPGDLVPVFGTWHLPATKLLGPKFVAFENELIAGLERFRPRLCVMEAPLHAYRQGSTHSARQQLGLAAYVDGEGHRARVHVREEQANVARKAVLGRGRFDNSEEAKAAAIAWCRAQGWMVGDDHQADALVLWAFTCRVQAEKQAAQSR